MNQPATLLVCAVLAAVFSLATCHYFITNNFCYDDRYLNWLNSRRPINSDRLLMLEALRRLPIPPQTNPEQIMAILDNESVGSEESMFPMFQELISLADPNAMCSDELIMRALEISSIICDSTERLFLENFVPFFITYGKRKFGSCSAEALQIVKRTISDQNLAAENAFDRFFEATLQLNGLDDREKMRRLRNLEFTWDSEPFEVRLGIEYLLHTEDYHLYYPEDAFYSFFKNTCNALVQGRQREINILTLARTFCYNVHGETLRVKKMKEYHRLCMSFKRPDQSRALTAFMNERIRLAFSEEEASS